jgi:hypothetical protein
MAKVERKIRISPNRARVRIEMRNGSKVLVEFYVVTRVRGTFVYELAKESDGKRYLVNLRDSSCNCDGAKYHRHCKHVDGMKALRLANKI